MRKYSTSKSDFSIIEENIETRKEADEREKFWIQEYNSYYNGYNSTLGGTDNYQKASGEDSSASILSNSEVFNIRKMKSEMKYTKEYIYSLYSDKISESGFHKVWNYECYPEVAPELNTREVIEYYIHTRPKGSSNKKCIFTKEQVQDIRDRYFINVESAKDIASIYNVNKSTIERIVAGKTYSDYPIPEPSFAFRKKKHLYTKEEADEFVEDFINSGMNIKDFKASLPESNVFSGYVYSSFRECIIKLLEERGYKYKANNKWDFEIIKK